MRVAPIALTLLLIPAGLYAATVSTARTLVVSEPPAGNGYFFGADVSVAAPVTGDLLAGGGSVIVSAPVSGDALVGGGSVDIRSAVAGDVRAAGGRVVIEDSVAGDVFAVAGSVDVKSTPSYAWVAGGDVSLEGGAKGPVTVYGSSIALFGVFAGDVTVTASNQITVLPGTVIHGVLRYDAPQQIDTEAATVDGGVVYTGKSFLPTKQQAQTFALAGAGVFFLVRILASIIAAGLLAGLFPQFAQAVADRTLSDSISRLVLLALLGFAVLVATPVLILFLLITFAGIGVALIVLAAYLLLFFLAYFYTAIIAGAALSRQVVKRSKFLWRDAVFGMLALSVIGLIPILGTAVFTIFLAIAAGAIVSLAYRFAFPREDAFDIE